MSSCVGALSLRDLGNVIGRPDVAIRGHLVIDDYRVDRMIGKGGSAVVVAATHQQSGERVAIKVLRAESALRPGAVERFVREACVAMRLSGDGVARVRDVCTNGHGLPYIVMDLLDGHDLGSILRETGRLDVTDAVDCILEACVALAEAHALGIVHRDLKPANLFVTMDDHGDVRVKLLDFGISKVQGHNGAAAIDAFSVTAPSSEVMRQGESAPRPRRDAQQVSLVTETHAVMGSPRYMAPEQHASARDVDARCDVWSLGVVMYELLTGKPPFDAKTLGELRETIRERRPSLRALDVPDALSLAIETCLAKETCDRYQSVEALAEAIAPHGSAKASALLERIAATSLRKSDARRTSPPNGLVFAPTLRSVSGRSKLRELLARRSAAGRRRRYFVAIAAALIVVCAVATLLTNALLVTK